MDLQESMVWFLITTVLVVTLLGGGVFIATHSYDRRNRHLPH
jgi:hypothetical protein